MEIGRRKEVKITTGTKIRLLPTPKQEEIFWKSAGVARWAYNYFVSEQERVYEEYLKNGKVGQRFIKEAEIRKYINNVRKEALSSMVKTFKSM